MLAHLLLVLVASAVELPSETSLAKLVQQYSQFGPSHLTGSSADEATSNWIYQELQAAGLEVQFQAYTLPGPAVWVPQHDGAAGGGYGCQLVVDLHRIPCYVVQQPPMRPAVLDDVAAAHKIHTLDDVPMKRVLVVSSAKASVNSEPSNFQLSWGFVGCRPLAAAHSCTLLHSTLTLDRCMC